MLCLFDHQVQDEIFGPVLSVGKFKTEEEAIKLANDTTYGLGAGLHSSTFNDTIRFIRVDHVVLIDDIYHRRCKPMHASSERSRGRHCELSDASYAFIASELPTNLSRRSGSTSTTFSTTTCPSEARSKVALVRSSLFGLRSVKVATMSS
jgi:hypothetical protein